MCTIYYLYIERDRRYEARPGPFPSEVRWKEWKTEREKKGTDKRKRERESEREEEMRDSVKEMVCLYCVPKGLNWAAGRGAITCVSVTAHSLITPGDS